MPIELPSSRRKKLQGAENVGGSSPAAPKQQVELPTRRARETSPTAAPPPSEPVGKLHPKLPSENIPEAPEAERAIIGAMMQDPANAVPAVVQAFRTTKYFCNPINATIYQALLDMWDSGTGVDFVTFNQYLRDQKLVEKVGGPGYIAELFTTISIGATGIEWWIDIVREKYLLRRMIGLGAAMSRAAYGHTEETPTDLLRQFTGSFERLLEDNKTTTYYDAVTVLNGQQPPLPRLIVRHLIHEGSKMIVGGTSKSRKTWALMDLALSVSTGSDWWGFHTNKSRVCYINLEIQDAFFIQRLQSLCEHKNVTPEEGWLKILNLRGHAEAIEDLRRRFSLLLKAGFFRLVIIDPVYKVLGGRRDENKAGDIATMLNEIERIAVDTGAAVAFAAHFSKGNQAMKESIDRIGGSGVFARDPDSVLTMTAHEDLDCFTVDATLRNLSPISSFVVRWEYPLFIRDEDRNPQQLKGGRPQTWRDKDILDEMSAIEGKATTALQKHMAAERGMPKASFYRIWEQLKKDSKIRVDVDEAGRAIWYRSHGLTDTSETSETSGTNPVSELL